jgi:hypothetical protein
MRRSFRNRVLAAVDPLEVLLVLVDEVVVAGAGIHVGVQVEVEREDAEEVVVDVVVGVDADDEAGERRPQTAVQGGGEPEASLVRDHADVVADLARDPGRRVGRPVVNDDHLEVRQGERLVEERAERPLDVALLVVGCHDDADLGHACSA